MMSCFVVPDICIHCNKKQVKTVSLRGYHNALGSWALCFAAFHAAFEPIGKQLRVSSLQVVDGLPQPVVADEVN